MTILILYVGLMGITDSAYLRISSPSLERLNASGFYSSSNEELLNNAEILVSYISENFYRFHLCTILL